MSKTQSKRVNPEWKTAEWEIEFRGGPAFHIGEPPSVAPANCDSVQELCARATERVYEQAAGRLLVLDAIQTIYGVPVPRLLQRLRTPTDELDLFVPILIDKTLITARRIGFNYLRQLKTSGES